MGNLPVSDGSRGISLAAYMDATDRSMEGGFVAKLKVFEEVKNILGDSFEGSAILRRAGEQSCMKAKDEPVWKGTKRYAIHGSKSGKIDSEPVAESENPGPPASADLGKFFGRTMSPHRMNCAYITGHGMGTEVAGMDTRCIADALSRSSQLSGEKPAIFFLEACLMGHLDGLRAFQGKAGIAIVTEETIPQDALPLDKMIVQASAHSDSPVDAARAMIDEARGKSGVRTIAAIDLGKIEPLAKAVDRLKALLAPEMKTEEGLKKIRRAVHASYYILPIGRGYGFGDLGEFLRSLSRAELPSETQEAVENVRSHLKGAVIAVHCGPNYGGSSGLSFNTTIGDRHFTWQELLCG